LEGTPSCLRFELSNPAAAYHYISIVENCCLTWSNGALRLVEGDQDFVRGCALDRGRSGLVAVADLDRYPHRLGEVRDGNQIHALRAQSARIEMLVATHDDLLICPADLNHVERRS